MSCFSNSSITKLNDFSNSNISKLNDFSNTSIECYVNIVNYDYNWVTFTTDSIVTQSGDRLIFRVTT